MIDFVRLLSQLPQRTTAAIIAAEAPRNTALRSFLRARLNGSFGDGEALLAPPALEGAFPWLPAESQRAGKLLASLNPAVRVKTFSSPFAHQVETWEHLLRDEPRSVIVSAGTGAGKTECFLLPVVERLARLAARGPEVTGVRAILLYPLNALINSQQKRLNEWLAPFAGRIRFALYNGATPEQVGASAQNAAPTEVLSRREIRAAPPPILVTNPSMLEYMLVRPQDKDILARSQGTLDFVILDEAHTYIGSQAAEIALLLRRVCLAFGREPREVRYVATSATIGDDEEADDRLRGFLAEVSGAPLDRTFLVRGRRAPLDLPPASPDAPLTLEELDLDSPETLWRRLAHRPPVQAFVRDVYREPRPWSDWTATAAAVLGRSPSMEEAARLLVATAASRSASGAALLPLRVHLFHRAIPGLWACCRPDCPGRIDGLDREEWRFGAAFVDAPARCRYCGGPVFELTFCSECGQEELECEQVALKGGSVIMRRPLRNGMVDEFALEADDTDDEGDRETGAGTRSRFFIGRGGASGTACDLSPDGVVHDAPNAKTTRVWLTAADEGTHCRQCGAIRRGGLLGDPSGKPFRVGAPFLLGTLLPSLLDTVPPAHRTGGAPPPAGGRRVLAFSDSRQGTARLAAKLQLDAERHFIRAYVYHTVQRAVPTPDRENIDRLRGEVGVLRSLANPDLTAVLAEREAQLDAALSTAPKPVPWAVLRDELARDTRLERHILPLWRERESAFGNSVRLAEFLLQREFARRPRRANNAETMGLTQLVLPPDKCTKSPAPRNWPLLQSDWIALLHIIATHFLRSRSIVAIDATTGPWMRWKSRFLVTEDRVGSDPRYFAWPSARRVPGRKVPAIPQLIAQACTLDIDDPASADVIGEWIGAAATGLRRAGLLQPSGVDGEILHLDGFCFQAVHEAALCPISRKILDAALADLTPFPGRGGVHPRVVKVQFPRHPAPFAGTERLEEIEEWMATDDDIQALSDLGIWSNLHIRLATTTDWHRLAEHSAQQRADTLKDYETKFAAGWINILSSSTTLEMGIDIGEIEAVAMSNAPPSAVNYRQRIGRAGRRGQPLAVGLTLCRDRPHDRAIFADPLKPLRDAIRPPSVALNSESIARRHVHAWLLGRWIREEATAMLAMQVGEFFGFGAESAERADACPASAFALWLDRIERRLVEDGRTARELRDLTVGTPLVPEAGLVAACREALDTVETAIEAEWKGLQAQIDKADGDAARTAEQLRLRRLLRSFVLGELAERGFLPSYGFPRNIVSFVTLTADKLRKENDVGRDEKPRALSYPSRDIDIALAEYAPGSEVVVDGLVYKSGGITLNWQRPASAANVNEIQALSRVWRCDNCSRIGRDFVQQCPECNAAVSSIEMLQPAGFAVDIRGKPHDNPLVVSYVRPPETWVSASDAPWRDLPHPDVGAYRATPAGDVIVRSMGAYRQGYAICLACGRAVAETTTNGDSDPLAGHAPLRKGGGQCPGNSQPFAKRRRHALGRCYRTDVFELRLDACRSRGAALAIAVAMREALAETLGIEADEMGVEAACSKTREGLEVWSAVLFDRADGGAGFASAAVRGDGKDQDLVWLLQRAAERLNCAANCDSVCERCLLSTETQFIAPELDRASALLLMQADVLPGLSLDPASAVFGPLTRPELSDLTDALGQAIARGGDDTPCTLFLHGDPAEWDLDQWAAAKLIAQWSGRGATICLGLPGSTLEQAGPEYRLALARLADRCGAAVVSLPTVPVCSDLPVLATVGATAWAATPASSCIGAEWGQAGVVRGPAPSITAGAQIDQDTLRRLPPSIVMVEVWRELDGPVNTLPARVRDLLTVHGFGDMLALTPTTIQYSDRYIASPLALRLATQLIAAFAPAPQTSVHIRTGLTRPPRPGWVASMLSHDWPDDANRKATFDAWLNTKGRRNWRFIIDKSLPHARRLSIEYPQGRSLLVTLDQGMGFLDGGRSRLFPFARDAMSQVASLSGDFHVGVRILTTEAVTFWIASRK